MNCKWFSCATWSKLVIQGLSMVVRRNRLCNCNYCLRAFNARTNCYNDSLLFRKVRRWIHQRYWSFKQYMIWYMSAIQHCSFQILRYMPSTETIITIWKEKNVHHNFVYLDDMPYSFLVLDNLLEGNVALYLLPAKKVKYLYTRAIN